MDNVLEKLIHKKCIKESVHKHDMLKNESINNVIACLGTKNCHLSESICFLTIICIAVGYTNIGCAKFYGRLFDMIGINSIEDPINGLIVCEALQRMDDRRKKTQKESKNYEHTYTFLTL